MVWGIDRGPLGVSNKRSPFLPPGSTYSVLSIMPSDSESSSSLSSVGEYHLPAPPSYRASGPGSVGWEAGPHLGYCSWAHLLLIPFTFSYQQCVVFVERAGIWLWPSKGGCRGRHLFCCFFTCQGTGLLSEFPVPHQGHLSMRLAPWGLSFKQEQPARVVAVGTGVAGPS